MSNFWSSFMGGFFGGAAFVLAVILGCVVIDRIEERNRRHWTGHE